MKLTMPYHKNPAVKRAWWDEDNFLHWEIDRGAKKKRLTKAFVETLFVFFSELYKLGEPELIRGAVCEFIQEHGPLWPGNCVNGSHVASCLVTFIGLTDAVKGFRKLGMPSMMFETLANYYFFYPLGDWLEYWDSGDPIPILPRGSSQRLRDARLLQEIYYDSPTTISHAEFSRQKHLLWRPATPEYATFMTVEDSPEFWPRFHVPRKFALYTWEDKKKWFIEELGWNACELLREGMQFYPVLNRDREGGMGHASIHVRCKDAYTFAIACLVLEWRYRVCPVCGVPSMGSTCGSPRCKKESLTSAPKQRVLDYLYRQKARDRITEEQYDFCKLRADELFWEDEIEDPRKLMQEVVASLKEQWPDEDFSFILKGFGSRTRRTLEKRKLT